MNTKIINMEKYKCLQRLSKMYGENFYKKDETGISPSEYLETLRNSNDFTKNFFVTAEEIQKEIYKDEQTK